MNLEAVWSQYSAAIRSFLHSRVADTNEVDDLLQEILIKTHKNLHQLQSETSVKAWLFQIANNTIIDFYRKRGRAPAPSPDELWYNENESNTEHVFERCVEPFINALPEPSAALLTAIDLQGQSQKEYAAALGISYSTLKSRVQKARIELRKLFEDCCHLTLDKQGNIADYELKPGRCMKC